MGSEKLIMLLQRSMCKSGQEHAGNAQGLSCAAATAVEFNPRRHVKIMASALRVDEFIRNRSQPIISFGLIILYHTKMVKLNYLSIEKSARGLEIFDL
jgi:hypothetical protein